MKFSVIGLIQCMAEVEIEAETFDEAVKLAKEKCLTGNPIETPDFEIQAVERRYDLEEDEAEDVARRIEDNESICDKIEAEAVQEGDTEEPDYFDSDEEALKFIRNLWKTKGTNPESWFRKQNSCKCNCKGKCKPKRKGVMDITVYDTTPFFWDFN